MSSSPPGPALCRPRSGLHRWADLPWPAGPSAARGSFPFAAEFTILFKMAKIVNYVVNQIKIVKSQI